MSRITEFGDTAVTPMTLASSVKEMAMRRSDSRVLPVTVLNERRRRAVMLRLSGMCTEQERGAIYWVDETGLRSDDVRG